VKFRHDSRLPTGVHLVKANSHEVQRTNGDIPVERPVAMNGRWYDGWQPNIRLWVMGRGQFFSAVLNFADFLDCSRVGCKDFILLAGFPGCPWLGGPIHLTSSVLGDLGRKFNPANSPIDLFFPIQSHPPSSLKGLAVA